jgi:predicted nucleic acid-binding protein
VTVVVDSDILIEVLRARNPDLLTKWIELSQSDNRILYSPVSAAELWAGVRDHEHDAMTKLFQSLVCAPIDEQTGRQAGDYLRQYRKSHGTELADALIASTALLARATLWTRNRKHFPMKEISFLQ